MFLAILPAFRLLSIYFQISGAILEELCCTETGEWAHSRGIGNLQAGKCKIYEENTLQFTLHRTTLRPGVERNLEESVELVALTSIP